MRNRVTEILAALLLCTALVCLGFIAIGRLPTAAIRPMASVAILTIIAAIALRELASRRHSLLQSRNLTRQMVEIEESNRLLKMTEATAHVGHWRIDLSTDKLFWSDETFAIHGLEPGDPPSLEDAIGFFHPDDRHIVENAVEGARHTGEPYTFRAKLFRPDGDLRHTESTARVETDRLGNPTALFGVFHDRTGEEAMQRELRNARDKARDMAHAKSSFLAKMSHEIRTPMNAVLGFAELLARSPLNAEQQRHINLITESGTSLMTLLNDILDLSKVEAGRIEITHAPTDIAHLVRRSIQMIEPMAREKALSLSHESDPELPPLVALDALRVRQILGNLLANAVRFTDEGGISVSVRPIKKRIEIEVRDTGIGIAEDMREMIFDTFAQAEVGIAQSRGGTGLGLAISRHLTELMGGALALESTKGLGSKFTLTLPLVPVGGNARTQEPGSLPASRDVEIVYPSVSSPPPAKREIIADQRPSMNAARILLAEDYDINIELICEMGRKLGYRFQVAENGAEAVSKVLEAKNCGVPFDLILMDLQMPKMGGIEAARKLREASIDPENLPIIALTANAFSEDVEACISAGMQEHLAKPLSMERLRRAIEDWLPERDRPDGEQDRQRVA